MKNTRLWIRTIVLLCGAMAVANAQARIIFETDDPFGGFLGVNGFDVFQNQSVGQRITVDADYQLTSVSVWFWNNDDAGRTDAPVTLTVRTDSGDPNCTTPGGTILDTMVFQVGQTGFANPILITLASVNAPVLQKGQSYWIVAESPDAPPALDPVWATASPGSGVMAFTDFNTGLWQCGGLSGNTAMIIEGALVGGITGDLNNDCVVDLADLSVQLGNFGTAVGATPEMGDVDGDGDVDLSDLSQLLANFGEMCDS